MPLDHYVPRVHLRKFYSAELTFRKLYRYPKSKAVCHPCGAEDVCRLQEGNTNTYIEDPRAIEEFLKLVEPKYNIAVENLLNGSHTFEDVLSIIGFCAYVSTCTPCAIRVGRDHLGAMVGEYAKALEARGDMPKLPEGLGYESLTEMLEDGFLDVTIDPKYPQAISISNILERVAVWAQSWCEVLINEHADTPFVTSDSPVALEFYRNRGEVSRVIPLSPRCAVRINPNIHASRDYIEGIGKFSPGYKQVSRSEVKSINRNLVRCAEYSVFSSIKSSSLERLVKKNKNYYVFPKFDTVPTDNGKYLISSFCVEQKS